MEEISEPVRTHFGGHTVKDSFDFIDTLSTVHAEGKIVASSDVQLLFRDVPINDVIDTKQCITMKSHWNYLWPNFIN